MKMLKKVIVLSLILTINFLIIPPIFAADQLIKTDNSSTVYYLDSFGVRHAFPNLVTYQSWYGADFSLVKKVSPDYLAALSLGKNITLRPGKYLVKVPSADAIYAVEQGGVLRQITDPDLLVNFYGDNWQSRLVSLPEVFFGDYIIGPTIDKDYQFPDDLLFLQKGTNQYFYKQRDILRPFASAADVKANRFALSDAVVSSRSYYSLVKPIVGFDNAVFNPIATPNIDNRDCENKNLKAGVIFLTNQNYSVDQIDKIQQIKKNIPGRFNFVTNNFSTMNVDYPTRIMTDDGYYIKPKDDGTYEIQAELLNSFYNQNPDVFDFLIVFTNFKIVHNKSNEIAYFSPASNVLQGIGRDIFNLAKTYGSNGKLKGVIMMGDIGKYSIDSQAGMDQVLGNIMHEFLHQWAAYIPFTNSAGEKDFSLLRDDDYSHWNIYDGFISPLGGSGWVDNGNSTFSSKLASLSDASLRQYSLLDLYLMGLVPYRLMPSIFYVIPQAGSSLNNTIAGTAQTVDVSQIIKANGPVRCIK
ncbi:MAG: hypothetical protein JW816_02230 [Candidatus Buchananbacteria bacterium]|nr:hypothetical protein [Candidatus Buchananbacteria bacterium]